MSKNAAPAHHKLPVKSQTIMAIMAAGINTTSRRMTRIITRPIMIKPMRPKRSKPKKLTYFPSESTFAMKVILMFWQYNYAWRKFSEVRYKV